jgi:hypothetical protein
MTRQDNANRGKEPALPEMVALQGYLNQLPQTWREKTLPLCERIGDYIRLQYKLLRLSQETVENLNMDVRYLLFDVEATGRERDDLLRELGIGGDDETQSE